MDNREEVDSEIERISNMYLTELTGGKYTSKGSFIGTNETKSAFFINKEIVDKRKDLIENLKYGHRHYWALIEDVVWGGKWENKPVASVVVISLDKEYCEEYQRNLIKQWQMKVKLMETNQRQLDIIDLYYGTPLYALEVAKIEEEANCLRNELKELNKLLVFTNI